MKAAQQEAMEAAEEEEESDEYEEDDWWDVEASLVPIIDTSLGTIYCLIEVPDNLTHDSNPSIVKSLNFVMSFDADNKRPLK